MSTFFRLDSFLGAPKTPFILCAEMLNARGEGADEGAVQAVVDYVKRIQSEAQYQPDEVPEVALQICELERYVRQVSTKGHADYFLNTGAEFTESWSKVKAALHLVRAKPFMPIARAFEALCDRLKDDPSVDITDPGAIENYLKPLDAPFHQQNSTSSLLSLAAQKVRRLSGVTKVAAGQLDTAYLKAAADNPALVQRQNKRELLAKFGHFHDPKQIGISLALLRLEDPDVFADGRAGTLIDLDGHECPMFPLDTLEGGKCAVVTPQEIQIYQYDADSLKSFGDVEDFDAADCLGAHLISVDMEEIDAFSDHADRRSLGLVMHDLLKRARIKGPISYFGCVSSMSSIEADTSRWTLILKDRMVVVALDANEASLSDPSTNDVLATVSTTEIDARLAAFAG